jgi:hypothetical protein
MSILETIPPTLLDVLARPQFIVWLQSLPIDFHARLTIYFWWLDYFLLPYTPDEINSLKEQA